MCLVTLVACIIAACHKTLLRIFTLLTGIEVRRLPYLQIKVCADRTKALKYLVD